MLTSAGLVDRATDNVIPIVRYDMVRYTSPPNSTTNYDYTVLLGKQFASGNFTRYRYDDSGTSNFAAYTFDNEASYLADLQSTASSPTAGAQLLFRHAYAADGRVATAESRQESDFKTFTCPASSTASAAPYYLERLPTGDGSGLTEDVTRSYTLTNALWQLNYVLSGFQDSCASGKCSPGNHTQTFVSPTPPPAGSTYLPTSNIGYFSGLQTKGGVVDRWDPVTTVRPSSDQTQFHLAHLRRQRGLVPAYCIMDSCITGTCSPVCIGGATTWKKKTISIATAIIRPRQQLHLRKVMRRGPSTTKSFGGPRVLARSTKQNSPI